MIFPISSLFFFFLLLSGVILSISSTSWFGAWIGLELNLMSFIPLIINKSLYSSEATLKYFLIQALASTLIILSSCLMMFSYSIISMIILMALLLKLGAAPFHFWFPQVMEGLSWLQTIILMTIQKLAPMFLISYLTFSNSTTQIIILSAILSSYVGALGGLNVMKLRKIMAFSSINHMSWMLVALTINDMMWILYFSFYATISSSVVFFLHSLQTNSISNLLTPNHPTLFSAFSIPLSLLSLGGLPPFTGFIPKWIMIQIMLSSNMYLPLLFLLSSALITLYFYLRMLIPYILILTPISSYNIKSISLFSYSFFLPFIIFLNMIGLFLPILFFLL
uniref:NADH-ubiquinone oxidoreductase chain 2 n=1 Tax=Macromedaeus distinguendus TaxID=331416 RepID=A0A891GZ23_9EUCA|nr:NADH dehydrogenase subunit 2 [Macromedaeus distinguendus]QRK27345.1 NADH dehydrogenase subunit 2 [Macromedaeus distinguendus]